GSRRISGTQPHHADREDQEARSRVLTLVPPASPTASGSAAWRARAPTASRNPSPRRLSVGPARRTPRHAIRRGGTSAHPPAYQRRAGARENSCVVAHLAARAHGDSRPGDECRNAAPLPDSRLAQCVLPVARDTQTLGSGASVRRLGIKESTNSWRHSCAKP